MYYVHKWTSWKICLLGQTCCGFPWKLLQTLSHSHSVIFCADWPWPATATVDVMLYTSRLRVCPGAALLWVWLERFCLESPCGIVVEFGKLISSRNRPLQSWSSPERIILLLDPVKLRIKLWSSNYDLPGKQKLGLIWYEMITIIKWIHHFGPPVYKIRKTQLTNL